VPTLRQHGPDHRREADSIEAVPERDREQQERRSGGITDRRPEQSLEHHVETEMARGWVKRSKILEAAEAAATSLPLFG